MSEHCLRGKTKNEQFRARYKKMNCVFDGDCSVIQGLPVCLPKTPSGPFAGDCEDRPQQTHFGTLASREKGVMLAWVGAKLK